MYLQHIFPELGSESSVPGPRKLDLTRENLNTLLGHGFSKQKATSTLSRGSGHTTGGHAPGKLDSGDPKGTLRETSREPYPRAGDVRPTNPPPRRGDPDRNGPWRSESRYKDPVPDRPVCRSASPPGNGFKQYLQTRLYNSQGKGPTRNERTAFTGGRPPSREPHRSQSRAQELPPPPPATPTVLSGPPSSSSSSGGGGSGGGHHSHRRPDHLANGYDTDSSQESREYSSHNSRSSRPWKPMREALNVDSVISSGTSSGNSGDGSYPSRPDRRQPSPSRRRPNSHSPSRDRERDRDRDREQDRDREPVAWGSREEHKPKSLMTIYEDEQRHEIGGSRSSLDSDSRGATTRPGTPRGVPTALKLHNDTWKIQRAESGYESSDRLSNGSANSPVGSVSGDKK
ncbi:hypothetical protein CRUP_007887 [Coryphaenoides rupestris]|nr:hypothetical protein CRUP_007887 [Coryphaenoides rupestris]